MGKPSDLPTGRYKDDPTHDDAGPGSSSLRLTEFADDDLPSYTDLPDVPTLSGNAISYHNHPTIPDSYTSSEYTTAVTHYPPYSSSVEALKSLILTQFAYPPTYTLRLHGTHTETYRHRDNKTEKRNITDFDIKLNMTHLFICPNSIHASDPTPCCDGDISCRYIHVPVAGEKASRGTIFANTGDIPFDSEDCDALTAWCKSYISNPSSTKSFTISRRICALDQEVIYSSLKRLVDSTSYRGHTSVSFLPSASEIVVYSPSRLNSLRANVYLRWFCYLTFLWLLTWPVLFLSTKRYTGIKLLYPFRRLPKLLALQTQITPSTAPFTACTPQSSSSLRPNPPPGAPTLARAKPLVQSESAFFQSWQDSLKRAVLAQHQGAVDEVYRAETLAMLQRGEWNADVQSTATGLLNRAIGGVVSVALGTQVRMGWGADT